ncbi:MAG: hypothetical protein HYR85_07150 [Planctomycetes bacterium]|nr:hypothetical protein [Planctomycetota bacterium]MBI3848539.1 hypothetical protein [Planctomycetota bacterium]
MIETRLTLLQRTVDDQLARNAIAIAGVQRRVEGAAALDETEREQIRRDVEEENRLAFERRLGELRAANQDVRVKWIGDVSGELGLTDAQRDGIVHVYESQTARWAEIFERIQRESMSPADSAEAFRSLRRETDGKLREFLSTDQLTRFRELESRRFSSTAPH